MIKRQFATYAANRGRGSDTVPSRTTLRIHTTLEAIRPATLNPWSNTLALVRVDGRQVPWKDVEDLKIS